MPRHRSARYSLVLAGTNNLYVKNYTAYAMLITNKKQDALNGPTDMINTHISRLHSYGYTVNKVALEVPVVRIRVLLGVEL